LTEQFISNYKDKEPDWGFGDLSWIVYKRTYARKKSNGELEEWWETVQRVIEATFTVQKQHCFNHKLPWSNQKAQHSAQTMYSLMFDMKFLPPGRGLANMDLGVISKKGGATLNNCGYHTTQDISKDFSKPFMFLMDFSMLGVGTGLDTRGKDTVKLQKPTIEQTSFTVKDSREGWVESVKVIFDAFTGKAKLPAHFDYSQIRPAGLPLKSFGGIASGPDPLIWLHKVLIERFTLTTEKENPVVDTTLIVDLANMIGRCVVSGGLRRTAEIIFGDPNDETFLDLKNPDLYPTELKEWRWASNNSVIVKPGTFDYSKIASRIVKNGEPGVFWLENAQKYGRLKDPENWKDKYATGANPCSEQTLESGEICCLVETFPAKHDNLEDFKKTLKFAYLYAKTVTLIPTNNPETNAIIGRNRRIGTSTSGISQAITKFGFRQFVELLDHGYNYLQELDNVYSRWLCIPNSIKLTSVKPSGSISLLAGATPGIHFPEAEYYIRNVRFETTNPLLKDLKKAGYRIEDSLNKDNTKVVSFPVCVTNFKKSHQEATIWEQTELVAQMQYYWADNQVSATIKFSKEEEKDLPVLLSMYENRLKSLSLCPHFHGYEQAPYVSISKEEYENYVSKLKPLQKKNTATIRDSEEKFCDGESCLIGN